MTQKEAKELTLELWRYLAEHPECYAKIMVPPQVYEKIRDFQVECPLCEMFMYEDTCEKCPLDKAGENCGNENGVWGKWIHSTDETTRKAAAERIVEIVSVWEPEEE
jgi:hypothetical protein